MNLRKTSAPLLVALAIVSLPAALDAQVRRGRAPTDAPPTGWAPVSIGGHAGYDGASARGSELVGVALHVPLVRSGSVALIPSAEMTFFTGAKEYQYSADVVWVSGGRQGGLYVGGGIGRRDSVIESSEAEPRREFTTYGIVAGVQTGIGRVDARLQVRWLFLQGLTTADYAPVPFSLGIALPLWGTRPQR